MSGITYDAFEGLLVLAAVCVLLVLVVILSYVRKMDVGKEFLKAVIFGGGQLFIVAALLTFLFDTPDWYIYIWVFIGTMAIVGGLVAAKRAKGMPKAFSVTTPSILLGSTLSLSVLAVSGAMIPDPAFIIPLAGMSFGNSMAICGLTIDRLLREMRLSKPRIEVALSLGATSSQAMEEYGRAAVRAALIPTIDRMKTLGIISIPGAMAGLLIAGTQPLVAAEYQIIIFLMIIGGGMVSALTVVWLSEKHLFTEAHQMSKWL